MDLSEISPEGQGRSQPMSAEQFSAYAQKGQQTLDALKTPVKGAGVYTAPGATEAAFQATRQPWGGATMRPGDFTAQATTPDQYAVSAKAPGQQSVTVPASVNQEQFSQAFSQAKQQFRPQLRAGANLGAFHNANTGNVEFDPSHIVTGEETAKQVGAATNAVGGAYHFGSGQGVFPPHVE